VKKEHIENIIQCVEEKEIGNHKLVQFEVYLEELQRVWVLHIYLFYLNARITKQGLDFTLTSFRKRYFLLSFKTKISSYGLLTTPQITMCEYLKATFKLKDTHIDFATLHSFFNSSNIYVEKKAKGGYIKKEEEGKKEKAKDKKVKLPIDFVLK
jgi:hypothetical protein